MGKNLLLGLIPVVLAFVLFRGDRRRTPLWWFGTVAFVLFLPNAPYLLADYRWLNGPWINAWHHDRWQYVTIIPYWSLYFAAGFTAFVVATRLAQLYVARAWSVRLGQAMVVAFCLLSAIGLYLGRADLNSWSVVTEPGSVADVLVDPPEPGSIGQMLLAFVVLLAGYTATIAVVERLRRRRARHRDTEPPGSSPALSSATGADPRPAQAIDLVWTEMPTSPPTLSARPVDRPVHPLDPSR
jgi:uncharacterized membrane protein